MINMIKNKCNEPLSESELIAILNLASYAPSGDNCQPWKFIWNGEKLFIFHDENRGKHSFNDKFKYSAVALGALLEYLKISASTLQRNIRYELLSSDAGAWATVNFEGMQDLDPQASVLLERSTDRQSCQVGGRLSEAIKLNLLSLNVDYGSSRLQIAEKINPDFIDYTVQTEQLIINWPKAFVDLMQWVRFSIISTDTTGDGMYWKTLGIKYKELFGLWLLKKYSWLLGIFRFFALRKSLAKMTQKQMSSAAALVLFSARDNNFASLVDIGRQSTRCWLILNQNGMSVQPMTSTVAFLDYIEQSQIPQGFPSFYIPILRKGLGILRKQFNLSEVQRPIFLLRTGVPMPQKKGATSDLRSRRLNLNGLLKIISQNC